PCLESAQHRSHQNLLALRPPLIAAVRRKRTASWRPADNRSARAMRLDTRALEQDSSHMSRTRHDPIPRKNIQARAMDDMPIRNTRDGSRKLVRNDSKDVLPSTWCGKQRQHDGRRTHKCAGYKRVHRSGYKAVQK